MAQQETNGLFIPTSQVWDVSDLYDKKGMSNDVKELFVRLYEELNKMSLAINMKDSGIYNTLEFVTGQTFFSNPLYSSSTSQTATQRPVFRKVINFGRLPTAAEGSLSVPHGIEADKINSVVRIYGASTDPVNHLYIALPCVSNAGNNIAVYANATHIFINAFGTDRSMYTITYVIFEYLKT